MGNLRKIVGVSLAVALVAALAVYVLIPKTGPNTANVVTNEPQSPTNGGSDTTGGGGTQAGGGGSAPTPHVRPPKLHGENSHGPKHAVCLPEKNHAGNGVSQYQGANWYRGTCTTSVDANPNGHAYGHAASGAEAGLAAVLLRAASGH